MSAGIRDRPFRIKRADIFKTGLSLYRSESLYIRSALRNGVLTARILVLN